MSKPQAYIGIDKDKNGGMTSIGKIVLDAWVFGLIPETETCEGWAHSRLNELFHRVNAEWDKYGCMVSQLPPELAQKHKRIYDEAIKRASSAGWSGDRETDDEA